MWFEKQTKEKALGAGARRTLNSHGNNLREIESRAALVDEEEGKEGTSLQAKLNRTCSKYTVLKREESGRGKGAETTPKIHIQCKGEQKSRLATQWGGDTGCSSTWIDSARLEQGQEKGTNPQNRNHSAYKRKESLNRRAIGSRGRVTHGQARVDSGVDMHRVQITINQTRGNRGVCAKGAHASSKN